MKTNMSRRTFLKGAAAGAGTLGLAQVGGGLAGCDSVSPSVYYGQERVSGLAANKPMVSLVVGEGLPPDTKVRLLYDTEPKTDPADYAFQSSERSGFNPDDAVLFELDSLSQNTNCYYRVAYDAGAGWVYRDERSFRWGREPGESYRFCIATDAHVYPYEHPLSGRQRVYRNVLQDRPDFLVTLGDDFFVAYQTKSMYPWPDREDLWNTMRKTRGLLDEACHSSLHLPVNGNHEGLYGWSSQTRAWQDIQEGMSRYFPAPQGWALSEGGDPLGRYGAFRWGDALFVWLDVVGFCEQDPFLAKDNALYILGEEQLNFLEAVLAGHESVPWKFLLAHEVFGGFDGDCSGFYGRGNANAAFTYQQAEIQALMTQYGVQAYFYGHDHVFSVSRAGETSYICAGHAGSGCPWADTLSACYEPSLIYSRDEDGDVPGGHVRVDVSQDRVEVAYVRSGVGQANMTVMDSHVLER